jgi:serine/threonine protein phosphatase 1
MIGAFFNKIVNKRPRCSVRLVRHLSISERKGRIFAVGDLHGEFHVLMQALHALNFDYGKEHVLLVGDIHDRGRNSEKCLDLLRETWADAVLGNHESMLLESVNADGSLKGGANSALEMWLANGGEWALEVTKQSRAEWRRLALDKLPLNWVVERRDGRKALVCHAEPDPDWLGDIMAPTDRSIPVNRLGGCLTLWGRGMLRIAHDDGLSRQQKQQLLRALTDFLFSVHGHTQLKTAGWVNNQLFADTGAVFGNSLTLVDLDHAIPGRSNGVYAWDIASERLLGYAATNLFG